MLARIAQLFGPGRPAAAPESNHVERVRIATCVLIVEAAAIDGDFSEDERGHVIETLQRRFELPREDVEELIELAHDHRQESFDLWKFTNQLNQTCSQSEKIEIIEEIWRVIYADGTLDAHEDHLIHKLAKLLNLNHPQLVQAKLKVLKEVRGA